MEYYQIRQKVMERIDEVGIDETVSLNFPVDSFLSESADQFLIDVDSAKIINVVSIIGSSAQKRGDNCGEVILPDEFLKIHSFKMKGWDMCVTKTSVFDHDFELREQFRATRRTPSRPAVTIDGTTLIYWGLDESMTHEIEVAKIITRTVDVSYLPDIYMDAISWLCASKVLHVMNEQAASAGALEQYRQNLLTFNAQ